MKKCFAEIHENAQKNNPEANCATSQIQQLIQTSLICIVFFFFVNCKVESRLGYDIFMIIFSSVTFFFLLSFVYCLFFSVVLRSFSLFHFFPRCLFIYIYFFLPSHFSTFSAPFLFLCCSSATSIRLHPLYIYHHLSVFFNTVPLPSSFLVYFPLFFVLSSAISLSLRFSSFSSRLLELLLLAARLPKRCLSSLRFDFTHRFPRDKQKMRRYQFFCLHSHY